MELVRSTGHIQYRCLTLCAALELVGLIIGHAGVRDLDLPWYLRDFIFREHRHGIDHPSVEQHRRALRFYVGKEDRRERSGVQRHKEALALEHQRSEIEFAGGLDYTH